jgi:anti-sigma B factor antagonist
MSGEFDLAGRELLIEELERLDRNGSTLIVDLRELDFIDSSGISALVEAKRRWRESGGRLELVCQPGSVQRALQMTGVDTLLASA